MGGEDEAGVGARDKARRALGDEVCVGIGVRNEVRTRSEHRGRGFPGIEDERALSMRPPSGCCGSKIILLFSLSFLL